MKSFLFLIFFCCLGQGLAMGQQIVTGRVVSAADNEPLQGAYVSTHNGKTATVTKSDGSFSLSVTPTDSLIVRYIGFESKVLAPPHGSPLVVYLVEDLQSLKEVRITTGYYELPKERTTGSYSVVSQEVLDQSVAPDIISKLKGVTNGVLFDERVSSNRKISVRGLSTLYAETEPLIVLNNFPYDGDINSINPNDVESITVLKDAAAASIWGVRAANGVIVINTKKASFNSPLKVSFNSNVTIGREPDMFYRRSISSSDFIEVEKMLFEKGFYSGDETDPSNPPLTPVVELLIASRDGIISPADANSRIEQLKTEDVRRDFQKYLYENSVNQQYTASLQGGSDKNSWYYSAGFDRNTGFTGDLGQRLSLRADNKFQLSKKISIRPTLAYTVQAKTGGRPGFSEIRSGPLEDLYPYARLADANGNPLPVIKNYRSSFASNSPALGLMSLDYVPLNDYKQQHIKDNQHEFILGVDAGLNLAKGLAGQLAYQYDRSWGESSILYDEESFYTRELVNQYTQNDGSGTLSFPIPKGGILDKTGLALSSHTARGQLKYQQDIGRHSIVTLIGTEIRQVKNNSEQYRTYGFDESGMISQPVDYTTIYNFYTSPNSGGIPYETYFSDRLNRYTSFYGNGAYTFDNRYTISGSARKDASNLFGVNSNQKGVPLWSAGAAWNVHHEKFFKSDFLDYLQVRGTFGYNGNLSRNLSALATVMQISGNLNSIPYGMIRTYPNPNLSWEKIATLNAGIDWRTKNNVLSGSLDFYRKNGRNLIGDQSIDPTSGVSSGKVRKNIASMKATGVDLQISSRNIDKTFKWNSGFIFNWNRDEVTGVEEISQSASSYISSGLAIKPYLGKPLRSIVTYKWNGLDPATGNPIGIYQGEPSQSYANIAFRTTLDDLDHHGSATPTVFGSLSNTFSYKKFSLYINMAYRLGYSFIRPSISYSYLFNYWRGDEDFSLRWQKPGDELITQVPSMTYPANSSRDQFYTNSSVLVEKADNIRLQDVNLSYRFNRLGALPVKDVQLYTYLRNPGFIWRANPYGLDPDYTGYLPVTPSISFSLKANF